MSTGGDRLANYAKMSSLAGCYQSHGTISSRDYWHQRTVPDLHKDYIFIDEDIHDKYSTLRLNVDGGS
jgi:hypothetical protein